MGKTNRNLYGSVVVKKKKVITSQREKDRRLRLTAVLQDFQHMDQDLRLGHLNKELTLNLPNSPFIYEEKVGSRRRLTEEGWVTSMLMSLVLKANRVRHEP